MNDFDPKCKGKVTMKGDVTMEIYKKPELEVLGDAAALIQGFGIHKEPDGSSPGPVNED